MRKEQLSTESGTTACPICGKDQPHYHHPQAPHVAQMIASWFCGAQKYSPAVNRWLETARGKSATKLADEIMSIKSVAPAQMTPRTRHG